MFIPRDSLRTFLALLLAGIVHAAVTAQSYAWNNVHTGTSGGFVDGIVFNQGKAGVAYARTDIGGVYRLNSDDTWTPLLDWANSTQWDYWYVDALATDAIDGDSLYLLVGAYTNDWDSSNAHILKSTDGGDNFAAVPLSFKAGGNMHGRGLGERLQIDPNLNSILFLGARDGHGLWKSTDHGDSWSNVTTFTHTGTYIEDPSDTSGISNDLTGITWITFDKASSNSGQATKRIFVGLADVERSVWMSEDAGATWTLLPNQLTGFIPHKGKIDETGRVLYVSYTEGDGPNDGVSGFLYRYNLTSGDWTDVSPPNGTYGFGGLDVDAQKSGTLMVAALNDWWPDTLIWRSTDFGATWSPAWDWGAYPTINFYYGYDVSSAPWVATGFDVNQFNQRLGWWVESLSIDPFDRNHFLYGTGKTVYGSKNLLGWDTQHNFTLASMGVGMEQTAVQALISPLTGPHLLSGVGDVAGWTHEDLNTAPETTFVNWPDAVWSTTVDLDWAGNDPQIIVRTGNGAGQIAKSTDAGTNWTTDANAPSGSSGSGIAISASGTSTLWRESSGNFVVSKNAGAYASVSGLPNGALIASDKTNDTVFYAASGSTVYVSTNGGTSFASSTTVTGNINDIKVNPLVTGDVWVATTSGLSHSTNFAKSFTALTTVSTASKVAVGAASGSGKPNSVFVGGTVGGVEGYFRSDDTAKTWVRVNDAKHQFTGVSGALVADPRVYGRLYLGTNGRGIFYGDILS